MIRVIAFLVMVTLLVAGAVWLANEPGSVVLVWRGWQMNTSFGVMVVVIAAAVAVVALLLRLIAWVRGSFRAYAALQRERRLRRGLVSLGDGFAAVHAGHGATARRLAREAASLLGESPAVLVLRKQAAVLDGDDTELKAAAEALLERPETEMAALRTLATKAMADGDVVGAVTLARRALTRGETPPWALTLSLDADISARRWSDALASLESRAGREVYTPTDHQRLRARLRIHQAQDLLAMGQPVPAMRAAQKAMDENGGTAALVVYAKAMTAQGKGRKASADLEKAWTVHPNAALLEAYRALVPGETHIDWARRVEHLVQNNPDDPESRLALAEAALRAELWGRARNRLAGLTTETTPADIRARAARLMADVEGGERGDTVAVARWLREALVAGHVATVAAKPPVSAAAILADF